MGQLLTLVVRLDGGDPNHRMNGLKKLCQNMTQIGYGYGFWYKEVMSCALLSTFIYSIEKIIHIEFLYSLIVQSNNYFINESIMICM